MLVSTPDVGRETGEKRLLKCAATFLDFLADRHQPSKVRLVVRDTLDAVYELDTDDAGDLDPVYQLGIAVFPDDGRRDSEEIQIDREKECFPGVRQKISVDRFAAETWPD